jgi:hypothetical protein
VVLGAIGLLGMALLHWGVNAPAKQIAVEPG